MFPLRWNFPFRKKDGTMVNLEDAMGGGGSSELPEYSAEDAGKVLTVTEEGELAWGIVSGGSSHYTVSTTNSVSELPTTDAEEVTT